MDFPFSSLSFGLTPCARNSLNDFSLRSLGHFRSAAASTRILHRQMKSRRTRLVFNRRVSSRIQQTFHRCRASRPHRPMQWRRAILILRVYSPPHSTKAESSPPGFSHSTTCHDVTIRRIMQRPTAPMILRRVQIRAGIQQQLRDLHSIPRGGDVQRTIVRIYPVRESGFESRLFVNSFARAGSSRSNFLTPSRSSVTMASKIARIEYPRDFREFHSRQRPSVISLIIGDYPADWTHFKSCR